MTKRLWLFKLALLFSAALLALTGISEGHKFYTPNLDRVAASDSVYLVKVSSIEAPQGSPRVPVVTFAVAEVLRGKPLPSLTLKWREGSDLQENSEWIIFHHPGGFKDNVGWAMEGDYEWLPIPVNVTGDNATAKWIGPLDGVRQYLRDHPAQS